MGQGLGALEVHVSSHSHYLLYDSHSCALFRLACACACVSLLGARRANVPYAVERERESRLVRIRSPGRDAYFRLRGKVAMVVAVAGRCRKPSSLIFAHAPLCTVQRPRQHHDEPARANTCRHVATSRQYSIQADALQDTATHDSSPTLGGALRQQLGHARLQYPESKRSTMRRGNTGHDSDGTERKRRLLATATLDLRTWHDATTTTMTPVGFPLARYSHHAPREGRSLSTACSSCVRGEGFRPV
jgi:hypothetical protein